MKKLSIYIAIAAVLAIGTAFASGQRSWPFTAPTVNGSGSVANPEQGNIIFDVISATAGVFKGFDGSSWVTLGGAGGGGLPVGTIIAFAGDLANIPAGYLPADGAPVNRITYTDLFNAIGEVWGAGDGVNTFNVPDLRGRFMRGVNAASGNDPDSATRTASNTGGNTGDNVGSLQADALQGHWHDVLGHASNGTSAVQPIGRGDGGGSASTTAGRAREMAADTVNGYGTPRASSETRPKNVYVNYIIKY